MKRREFLRKSTFTGLALASSSFLIDEISAAAASRQKPGYHIEGLGEPATGDVYRTWRLGRHPQSDAVLAIGALAKGGFIIVDPAAMTARQILAPKPLGVGWAVGQAPNGDIYQADNGKPGNPLYCWDWQGEYSRAVATLPGGWSFTLDVAADGRVYLPDYQRNRLYRYNPKNRKVKNLGSFKTFGQHIRKVFCGDDGLVYVSAITYGGANKQRSVIIAYDPRRRRKKVVEGLDESTMARTNCGIARDAEGRICVPVGPNGAARRHQIINGRVQPEALPQQQKIPGAALRFANGGYLKEMKGTADLLVGDADGREQILTVQRKGSPLRLFSLAAGAGKIWLGTIIPLTLWSYDTATRKSTSYGNPTPVDGEIYNMAFGDDKLYLASYPNAAITRLGPLSTAGSPEVVQLGRIKSEGLPLHRPHGRATDENGHVFFAALGSYGCEDSGIARITTATDEMTSWIYPNTTFSALVYCHASGGLLVSERRKGEGTTRFTFISPHDGKVLWSQPVFDDIDGAGGGIISWLDDGDWVYGLHAHTATLFVFSLNEKKIKAQRRELRFGEHFHNALANGHDGRIWGVTDRGVYAASRDLKRVKMIAKLRDDRKSSYCFGTAFDENGAFYFANGTQLMRMRE